MHSIKEDAGHGPETAQCRLLPRILLVKSEYPEDSKVHAVHHVGAGSKVVQFLCQREIPRVEYRAERPTRQATVAEREVVFPQGMPCRDRLSDSSHALPVCQKVEDGEEDGERFLHPKDSIERPLPVELHHRTEHRGITSDSTVRHDMLAGVIAFRRARP